MPTILRRDGFRFFFYSNEGREPPHVHIDAPRGTAKFWLEPPRQAGPSRLGARDIGRIRAIVVQEAQRFLAAWHEHFEE